MRQWWRRATANRASFRVGPDTRKRLRDGFGRVLRAMPPEDLAKVIAASPRIVCQAAPADTQVDDDDWACVVFDFPGHCHLWLSPTSSRWPDDEMCDIIAHELGHVVGEHYGVVRFQSVREREADAFAVRWGFRPRYPEDHLEEMRRREDAGDTPWMGW